MLDIDSDVASCQPCNSARPHQQKEPFLIHPVPDLPWSFVSADIFDWSGLQYLILVDSYSGWFEMSTLSDLSSRSVIMKMKQHFAVHGIPSKLLTDNGPQFASREFKSFASEWSFEHVTSSPYFPQSNEVSRRMQSNKPRACLRNVREMVQTPCLAFLTSGMFQGIKS